MEPVELAATSAQPETPWPTIVAASPTGETDLKSPARARTQGEAMPEPAEDDRWRLAIEHEIRELGSAIQSELRKKLESFATHFRKVRFGTERDEQELARFEDLVLISGVGAARRWTVDPEALATHEVFRSVGAKERIEKANKNFQDFRAEIASPPRRLRAMSVVDSEVMLRLLAHWEALRGAARQPSLWTRFWQTLFLGRRRTRPLEERCTVLHEIVDRPEFKERLLGALETYALALLRQERGAFSSTVSAEESAPSSTFAPNSGAGIQAETGHEHLNVAAKVARWEGRLQQAVRDLRESVFGDPEPRPRRRAFLLALVPEDFPWPTGFSGLKNALESSAAELDARCLVERYSGDRLWIVAEDLFNSADHVRLFEGYREAYEHGEPKELYHLDRRWVEKLGQRPGS
jgi:hypothetical protein